MIEKIYIPTVNRVNSQITYHQLPLEFQKKVIFVIQNWEKEKYFYDADYLILPEDITTDSYNAIARTRKFIYDHAKNYRYAVLDDDLIFMRRNSKYWTGKSNMEKSKRKCTENDIYEMFALFEKWLDEVTLCACMPAGYPPLTKAFKENGSIYSNFFMNGYEWKNDFHDMQLEKVRVGEDILLVLNLLTRGYKNRISGEFLYFNQSIATKKDRENSTIWKETKFSDIEKDYEFIESLFPNYFKILRKNETNDSSLKNRDIHFKIDWKKAYENSQSERIEKFFLDK